MISLPFSEFPDFTQDVVLDGVGYRFAFLWSDRTARWSMSIRNLSDDPILEGAPLAINMDAFAQYHHLDIPPGELWAADVSESLAAIGRNDIRDGTVELVYRPVGG